MLKLFRNRKGQSVAEYAIVIALVIGAGTAMQIYVKRSLQGRIAGASDNFTAEVADETGWAAIGGPEVTLSQQWEPDYLSSRATRDVVKDEEIEELAKDGTVTRTIDRDTRQAGDGANVAYGDADYQLHDYSR